MNDHEIETVLLRVAVDALVDALLEYNVPTGRIVAEFKRLVAEYAEPAV